MNKIWAAMRWVGLISLTASLLTVMVIGGVFVTKWVNINLIPSSSPEAAEEVSNKLILDWLEEKAPKKVYGVAGDSEWAFELCDAESQGIVATDTVCYQGKSDQEPDGFSVIESTLSLLTPTQMWHREGTTLALFHVQDLASSKDYREMADSRKHVRSLYTEANNQDNGIAKLLGGLAMIAIPGLVLIFVGTEMRRADSGEDDD